MEYTTHPQDATRTPDQGANSALAALERLSLQSETTKLEVKTEPSWSRPTSSHTVASTQGSESSSLSQFGRASSTITATSSSPEALRRASSSGSSKGQQHPQSPHFPPSRPVSSARPIRSGSQTSFRGAEIPQPLTAASIGAEYFAKELASHDNTAAQTETVVIIHEACYGHRFSRPKTSKAALSTIVERPERLTAVILGLATAYVRLGSRHAGGLAPPKPGAEPSRDAPFAIRRSSRFVGLTSPSVVAVHGLDWMNELQAMCLAAGARLALDGRELVRPTKLDALGQPIASAQLHEGDLYLCAESLEAMQGAIGGVCDAVDAVFSDTLTKRAFVAVRPPGHHCSADYPSGFCWLNNVHVGIQHAAQAHGLTHVVIFDIDLHHGDGSQEIAWATNERNQTLSKNVPHSKRAAIGYYSLHDINSYPCEMGDKEKVSNASMCIDNAHGQSIWNVHLEPWSSEADFERLYEQKYSVLFEKARKFLQKQTEKIKAAPKGGVPRAAIFISAGFDANQWEGAGMQRHTVNVPTSFYERFTRDAVKLAHEEGTAVEGRVISVLEGGYSNRALTSGVLSHMSGLCQPAKATTLNGTLESMHLNGTAKHQVQASDHKWWNSEALHALETYEVVEAPKKPRTSGFAATFASPTESFSNKVVDHEKFQRSMSGTWRALPDLVDSSVPEVDWIAASHALSKAIIPTHRSTTSCKPEELARAKKQRQSEGATIIPVEVNMAGRQLRERKSKVNLADEETPKARTGLGRKTLDGPMTPTTPTVTPQPRRASSRRSSAANTLAHIHQPVPAVPSIPAAYQSTPSTPLPPLKQVPKRRSPVKQPASRIPTTLKTESTLSSQTPSLKTESSSSSYATAPSTSEDLDGLTSAVRRITLKVGTREEHDRRAAERAAGAPSGARAAAMQPATPIADALVGQVVAAREGKQETRVPSWSATGHIPFANGR